MSAAAKRRGPEKGEDDPDRKAERGVADDPPGERTDQDRGAKNASEETALVDCRARGYRRPDDLVRLAYLQAADGNIAEASSLLRAVDDRRRLRVDRDRPRQNL